MLYSRTLGMSITYVHINMEHMNLATGNAFIQVFHDEDHLFLNGFRLFYFAQSVTLC